MFKLAWHFDFHSHKNIRINHDPDVDGMARTLRECGIEEIITFAKGHDGFAYYPTSVGTVHPRMKGDAFGDVVNACKAQGIRVLAYVSFGVDGEAGRKHPEWAQVLADGPEITEDWFVSVCPFTPYLDQLMLPMIAEILDRYPVDGLFFDTMSAMGICYCDSCEREFREKHRLPIPREPDDPHWAPYGRFRHERSFRMIEKVGRFISDRKPDAKVGFNHVGSIHYPERMPKGISCLTLDFSTSGPQSRQASMCAAFGSTANLPSDVMNTIFNQGWGDWSPRPLPVLEQVAASVWARRCRPYLGDRLHPANRLDPISVRAIKFMANVTERISRAYPDDAAALAPDILLLHGPKSVYREDMARFAVGHLGVPALVGAHHLLLDAGANFAIVAEAFLADHISNSKLVVLPEMAAIERETEDILKDHLDSGGKLLIVGQFPTIDGAPPDWIGASREKNPWQDHIYLPPWSQTETLHAVLVRGDFHKLNLHSAECVLPAVRPYDCDHGVRFGWGIGPASDQPSPFAALTRSTPGKGEVWYLEAPIFSDYNANANWTQIAWFRGLIERLVPQPLAKLLSDAGSVEVVAHANADATWAFLINHGGEQSNGERQWTRTFSPVPPFPVTLFVRDPAARAPKAVTCRGKAVPWTAEHGAVAIAITMNDPWRVIRVDWK